MQFDAFCRAHGLVIDHGIEPGRWVRVPTLDHPRKKNGAYKYLGDIGWVQNHAVDMDVSTWRADEKSCENADLQRIHRQAAEFDDAMRRGWERAAQRAEDMLRQARPGEHNYLHIKGFGDLPGLVTPDGALMVPMRHWRNNRVVGAQLIRWVEAERKYDKKMLPGMRAKGAVLRLGSPQAPRTWLVEGYATGLSVEAAVRLLRLRDSVTVCFSAGNLVHVAKRLADEAREVLVFADHDASGAGERAALATGARWCMSPEVGEDANDLHKRAGIFAVSAAMVGCKQPRPEMAMA
jgi:putative DNA primase/helicase